MKNAALWCSRQYDCQVTVPKCAQSAALYVPQLSGPEGCVDDKGTGQQA
jgi:hypothetical protein